MPSRDEIRIVDRTIDGLDAAQHPRFRLSTQDHNHLVTSLKIVSVTSLEVKPQCSKKILIPCSMSAHLYNNVSKLLTTSRTAVLGIERIQANPLGKKCPNSFRYNFVQIMSFKLKENSQICG